MKLSGGLYVLRETGRSLWRNAWMSVASISTVAISLLVLASFLVISINLNHVTAVLQSEVEVRVFMKSGTSRAAEMQLMDTARHWPDVRRVTFFTKRQAARALQSEFPAQQGLFALVQHSNPLFDGYDVFATTPQKIPQLAARFRAQAIVHNVIYQGQVVHRLVRLSKIMQWTGWIIESLLSVATLFIIMNTIRLAVFARRREIHVMKLVGATDWFIRWPFVLEGLVLGLIGAALSLTVVANGYRWIVNEASVAVPFWPMAPFQQVVSQTALFIMVGGVLIGALASAVAVHRFLRV
ncbi:MAG: permease-like cell division protein FtsX [Thermaerobacter sp.]|nr:permease-like cell division protein FtsX [Thermaerobacter sp.]